MPKPQMPRREASNGVRRALRRRHDREPPARRVLVVTPEVLPERVSRSLADEFRGAELRLLAPALSESLLAHWVWDSDEALAGAGRRRRSRPSARRRRAASAEDTFAHPDPHQAVVDALADYRPDALVVFVRDESAFAEAELDELLDDYGIRIPAERRPLPRPRSVAG